MLFPMSMRDLPSVDAVIRALSSELPRTLVAEIARAAVADTRARLSRGEDGDALALAGTRLEELASLRPRSVINATGVLLHTNLGRAPLAAAAAEQAQAAALSYTNVEFDVRSGERGVRAGYARELARAVTGAEAALIVNNNAAALFLTLTALAAGRTVPVSRGELIEIGGSYRLPELMAATPARLIEVGTTNRTHLSDYAAALTDDTGMILKVHPSNYRVVGFTEEVPIGRLAELAHPRIPLVFDQGSGLLDETLPWLPGPPPRWLAGEPGVRQALEAGADLVLFSGDKLLGGPQAGLLVGRADLLGAIEAHPIARAVRSDGATLAALASTLELYAAGRGAEIPFWAMAALPEEDLRRRLQSVAAEAGIEAEIRTGSAVPGAGSVPGATVPSPVLVLKPADLIWRRLLDTDPPVVARREAGEVLIDLRAVPAELDGTVGEAVRAACRS